jgi:Concanavalin A-like lectin/glucanases superfamily
VPRRRRVRSFASLASLAALVALAAGTIAWTAACNALSGVDDLVPVEYSAAEAGRDVASPADVRAPPPDAHVHDFDAAQVGDVVQPLPDAGVVDANAGLCNGLTSLFRFDGTTTSAQGAASTGETGIQYVPGKFGQALAATTTQVDYDAKGGAAVSANGGTVSMWIDALWDVPCDQEHAFFWLDNTGIYTDCEAPGVVGLYLDIDQNTSVYSLITPASVESAWSTGWNHLVATWSTSPPSMTITLNGAVGSATTEPWSPPDPSPAAFHIGSTYFATLANLDDVAIWTRPLSPAEIQTVFLAGASVGDVCKLP